MSLAKEDGGDGGDAGRNGGSRLKSRSMKWWWCKGGDGDGYEGAVQEGLGNGGGGGGSNVRGR